MTFLAVRRRTIFTILRVNEDLKYPRVSSGQVLLPVSSHQGTSAIKKLTQIVKFSELFGGWNWGEGIMDLYSYTTCSTACLSLEPQPALGLGLVAVNERGLCLSICGLVGWPHPFLCRRRSLWNFPPTPTKKSGVSYICSLLSLPGYLLKTLNYRNIFYSRYIPTCLVKSSVFSLFGESGISWHG